MKALQRVGVFFRGLHSRSLDFVRKTFITNIRQLLEYNSTVWTPAHKYLIDKIENVKRSIKILQNLKQLDFNDVILFKIIKPI